MASGDKAIIAAWGALQSSDHLYWMSTKGGSDGQVTSYFSPYRNPQAAYESFMAALENLGKRAHSQAAVGGTA
jgi:alpha-amylase